MSSSIIWSLFQTKCHPCIAIGRRFCPRVRRIGGLGLVFMCYYCFDRQVWNWLIGDKTSHCYQPYPSNPITKFQPQDQAKRFLPPRSFKTFLICKSTQNSFNSNECLFTYEKFQIFAFLSDRYIIFSWLLSEKTIFITIDCRRLSRVAQKTPLDLVRTD